MAKSTKAQFQWDDPLLLNDQLTEDERMVRDAARAYCQDRLQPRVLEAFRHEKTDAAIFREMGALGGELLDLALDIGQLRLDREDVRDPGRLLHDLEEGALGRAQVADPRVEGLEPLLARRLHGDLGGSLTAVRLSLDALGREHSIPAEMMAALSSPRAATTPFSW